MNRAAPQYCRYAVPFGFPLLPPPPPRLLPPPPPSILPLVLMQPYICKVMPIYQKLTGIPCSSRSWLSTKEVHFFPYCTHCLGHRTNRVPLQELGDVAVVKQGMYDSVSGWTDPLDTTVFISLGGAACIKTAVLTIHGSSSSRL